MSLEGGRTEPAERHEETRAVKTFPLNSKRLTAKVVQRIVATLKLPKAPLSDKLQMLEGSLGKERKLWSVQVDVVETETNSIIRLRDAGGVFLEVPLDELDEGDEATTSLDETEETEVREGRGNGSPGQESRNGGGTGSYVREDNGAGDGIGGDDAEEYEPHGGGEGVERSIER